MLIREIDKIYNTVKVIKKMNPNKVTNNNIVIDIIHGVDITSLSDLLNSKKIKTVVIPTTQEYERRLIEMGREYLDIYKLFPSMEIMMDGFMFYDRSLQDKVDRKTIEKYDCFIIDQMTAMSTILREFISLYFRTYYPNKVVLHVYDCGSFIGTSDRIQDGLEMRPSFVLNKDADRLPDFSASLGYLASRVRAGKHEILSTQTPSTDAYEFRSVVARDFIRKFSIEELLSYKKDNRFGVPQFFCSNVNLGMFTRILRDQLGYKSILPQPGEELIAYNTFKTNNVVDNIVVKKGTVMKFNRMIANSVFEVTINEKIYNIVVDINVFPNVLEKEILGEDRYRIDPTIANVFYNYALTSEMFEHTTYNNIIAYIDGVISTSYLYSLLKTCRKSITILIDSLVVNTDLI